jgi:type III pantothenate kinase
MIVVADIGNTRIKWARVERGTLAHFGDATLADGGDAAVGALLAAVGEPGTLLVVANVAGPEIEAVLRQRAAERETTLTVVRPAAAAFGVRCAYADPARLGADRWVAIVAAHLLVPGPACVIDAGTTVTLDAVTADGVHVGGLIMAGPAMIARVLERETRGIGRTSVAETAAGGLAILGASTNAAVAHGAMLGIAAGIDRAVAEVCAGLDAVPAVVLTGGGAPALKPWLRTEVSYRPHFVLEGLARIAAQT